MGKPSGKPLTVNAARGIQIGSAFTFVFYVAGTLCYPFDRAFADEMGCDALCQGSIQSAKSAIGLLGSVAVGRLSDQVGRRPVILLSTLGALTTHLIRLGIPSLAGMWIALPVGAFLGHNMTTLKALFADYFISGTGGTVVDGASAHSERAGAIGRLGLVMGLALMVGSGGGPQIVSNFHGAHTLAIVLILASLPLLWVLPTPQATESEPAEKVDLMRYLRKLVTLEVLKNPGAWVILGLRVCMALAFWVFYAVWTPSLKTRFDFGPKEQGQWMAFIGISYAVAQGVVAKPLIATFAGKNTAGDADSSALLTCCMVVLGVGRVIAITSMDLRVVYASFGTVVAALGIANCILNSAGASLAGESETGGLYGLLDAIEKFVGIIGPMLGGILSHNEAALEEALGFSNTTLCFVVGIYAAAAVVSAVFYHRLVEVGGKAICEDIRLKRE